MEIIHNGPISIRSEAYADDVCCGDNTKQFSRGCIAAAYICGAAETIGHVCMLIEASAKVRNGLDPEQARKLLNLIKHTEGFTDGK